MAGDYSSQEQRYDPAGCQYIIGCPGFIFPVFFEEQVRDYTFQQNLGAAVLNGTTTYGVDVGQDFKLNYVSMACDQLITETFSVYCDSGHGAAYDFLIAQWSLINQRYVHYVPDGELVFLAGDEINVRCTAAGGAGTVSVVVSLIRR